MRFEEMLEDWERGRLTQDQGAMVLGMSVRTFRRYVHRFKADGEAGLMDRRLEAVYHRQVPADEWNFMPAWPWRATWWRKTNGERLPLYRIGTWRIAGADKKGFQEPWGGSIQPRQYYYP